MISIRMRRVGRKKLAQFRIVVQDSKRTPTSGRIIANLGFYNPHSKDSRIDQEKTIFYLKNGAQPSSRVVKFLTEQKIKLPKWVRQPSKKTSSTKNPAKLRRHSQSDKPQSKSTEKSSIESKSKPSLADSDKKTKAN